LQPQREDRSARTALRQAFSGRSVLVAEDDPANQEVTRYLLEDAGLVPDVACNGVEAVALARSGAAYALILMDMQMPELDGLQATRAIRRLPGMAGIPILAFTANALAEDRERCLNAGMNAHIGKPVDSELLYATLFHWLSDAQAQADG
jgi:CheY-like chemotaxis protein